jgi:hypothetical protein
MWCWPHPKRSVSILAIGIVTSPFCLWFLRLVDANVPVSWHFDPFFCEWIPLQFVKQESSRIRDEKSRKSGMRHLIEQHLTFYSKTYVSFTSCKQGFPIRPVFKITPSLHHERIWSMKPRRLCSGGWSQTAVSSSPRPLRRID